MKRSKFSEAQVAYALRQADAGTAVGDVCRQLGISEATFYVWKKRYGHLGVNEVRRVRQRDVGREENVGGGSGPDLPRELTGRAEVEHEAIRRGAFVALADLLQRIRQAGRGKDHDLRRQAGARQRQHQGDGRESRGAQPPSRIPHATPRAIPAASRRPAGVRR